jgi:penicillin amidase
MKKRVLIILSVLLLIAAIPAILVIHTVLSPIPDYRGEITVPGLDKNVTVYFDQYAIGHIEADSEEDLFFAQGYLTARERLFQMDMTRLAGRGELSSLFGEKTLDKDRYLKTIGIYRMARRGYSAMDERTRNILKAYSRGINAFIDAGPLPLEYTILRSGPRPWVPEDSVAVALLMSYSLTRSKKVDLVLHRLGMERGRGLLELLSPSYPDFAPTVSGGNRQSSSRKDTLFSLYPEKPLSGKQSTLSLPRPPMEFHASNWMIFSGKRTVSGKPLFAGSPDLKPTLPALFYLSHLVCEEAGINVMGGALPGTPGIGPLGFNGHMAWSAVNGRGDEMDYYLEKVNPDNPDEYLTEKGYRPIKKITETLKIQKEGKIVEEPLVVRLTRHGPIISDVTENTPENCSMKWAAHEVPATDIQGLLEMNRARNFNEFREALKKVKTINLGLGYADKDGNIGWQFTASPPMREKGDGTLPVPGWKGEYEWTGFIPYERIPRDLNPESGWAASFNNEPGTIPEHLTNFYLFERAIRFNEIMEEQGDRPVDRERILEMQLDTVSVVARRWVPRILTVLKREKKHPEALTLLENWDLSVDRESSAATLFNYFYGRLLANTLSDEAGESLWKELSQSYLYYIPDLALTLHGEEPGHPLFDDVRTPETENRDRIILRSLEESLAWLKENYGDEPREWKWKRGHRMPFEHPLGSVLSFLNLAPIPTDGSHHTINSGFWDLSRPFEMNSGGVIRMIVDFGDIPSSTIISPPGQSGHFGSDHYGDLAETWAEGRQVPMRFESYGSLERVLVLRP